MFEKILRPAFWMSVMLLCSAPACNSTPSTTAAEARAAALTNKVDDDRDGHVDEQDEGLDEDQDGTVDEQNEHKDACEHRGKHRDHQDSDAGVDAGPSATDEDENHDETEHQKSSGDGHHAGKHGDGDKDANDDSDESTDEQAKMDKDIAAIDCSDQPSVPAVDAGGV